MPDYLFVTGKLAADALMPTLDKMEPDFEVRGGCPEHICRRPDGHAMDCPASIRCARVRAGDDPRLLSG